MKKLISFIVALLCLLNGFCLSCFAKISELTIEEFHNQLCEMISQSGGGGTSSIGTHTTNRLIVKTKSNQSLDENYGASGCVEGYKGVHIFQYKTKAQTDAAYKAFQNDEVEFVEYDFYFQMENNDIVNNSHRMSENDNHFSWNSEVAEVDKAFDLIKQKEIKCGIIKVAVIDSGLYVGHAKFSTSRIIESNFTPVEEESRTEFPSNVDDMNHGTHVFGIIYDNSMDNVLISPYRVYGSLELAPYSLVWTAFEQAVKDGANIINMSIAGKANDETDEYGNYYHALLNQAIVEATEKNVVVVVAAGNNRSNADTNYPGNCTSAITVAATDERNLPDVSYSASGECVDVAAPGTNINSTVPRLWNPFEHDVSKNQIYDPVPRDLMKELSGTSQAAPLVSAAAAFILSIDPTLTPAEVEKIIKETAYIPDNWEQYCGNINYGSGIVNFYNIAKYMVFEDERESQTPEIKITSDNKFEISVPDGSDARFYYTLDGSMPTLENHLTYSEPLRLINTYSTEINVVCHENGKLISEPVTYDMITYKTKTIFYKSTGVLKSNAGCKNAYWSSYNSDIAQVDNQGNITANSVGNTKITCLLQTGERIIWKVNVIYNPIQAFFVLFFFGFLWI